MQFTSCYAIDNDELIILQRYRMLVHDAKQLLK
jgi:hypothetical protein